MNITDHLDRAASEHDTEPLDLHRLARVARVDGSRVRRRRQGAALLGTAVVVGLVVTGTTALVGHGPGGSADVPAASATATATATATAAATSAPAPTGLDVSDTGPFTGRGVAAALRHSVEKVSTGRSGAYAGQDGSEAYARLDWTDSDGLGVSVVGINVQPRMRFVSSCGTSEERCTRRAYHGGTLTTYEEHARVADGVGIRRVADFLRADGTRVVVSATNGYELSGGRWDLTRAQPPLDYAQLTRIVSHRWWGSEIPTYFLRQGEQLRPYDDLGGPWPAKPFAPTPSESAQR